MLCCKVILLNYVPDAPLCLTWHLHALRVFAHYSLLCPVRLRGLGALLRTLPKLPELLLYAS